MSTYRPLGTLILLEVVPRTDEAVGSHGLVVPASAQQDVNAVGRVVARGPDAYKAIEVGSLVLFQPYLTEARWNEDGRDLALVDDLNVYAAVARKE